MADNKKACIIKENDLKKMLGDKIYYLKTRYLSSRPDVTLDMSEEEFVNFLFSNGAAQVFVIYRYYSEDDLLIKNDMVKPEDISGIPPELIKKAIAKYNNSVKKIDFENPRGITMLAVVDGLAVAINKLNPWLENDAELYTSGEQAYYDILDRLSVEVTGMTQTEIYDKNAFDQEQFRDDLRRQFYEYIIRDRKFNGCINVQARYAYASEIIYKAQELPFLYEFKEDGEYNINACVTFLNIVWRLRKQGITSYEKVKAYL